ncbi:hypothetical protein LNW71_04690 [Streptomyces sp. RKAG290]|nr:hypothetical protein [Streptomyces sp. RKAG290]
MTTTVPATTAAAHAPAAPTQPSVLRSLLRNRFAALAFAFLVLIIVCALCAPLIAPADPAAQDLLARLRPPPGSPAAARPISWAPTSSAATCSRGSSTAPGSRCSSVPAPPCSPVSSARSRASPPDTSAAGPTAS